MAELHREKGNYCIMAKGTNYEYPFMNLWADKKVTLPPRYHVAKDIFFIQTCLAFMELVFSFGRSTVKARAKRTHTAII